MNKIKLIASDLDGTLLLNGSQAPTSRAIELIHQLYEKGILFVVATGRQYPNVRNMFSPIKDEMGYICENGCLLYYQNQELSFQPMDEQLAKQVILDIENHDECEALVSGKNTSYLKPKTKAYYHHMKDVVKNDVTLVEDLLNIPEPYFKLAIYQKDGVKDISYWREKYGEDLTIHTSGNVWFDINPKGINKGSALLKLMSHLNIPKEETMAFGDNENDIEMLETVQYSFAMEKAKDSVKSYAKEITTNVEEYLEKVLKEKV